MPYQNPNPKMQFFDANGNPLVGGKVYTYAAGTTTPLATYVDQLGTAQNTNPVILDSRGEANIWFGGTVMYAITLKTGTDVLIYTVDNVGANFPASNIPFTPVGTIAATTVQAAIAEVVSDLAAPTGTSLVGANAYQTQDDVNNEWLSVRKYGAVGDGVADDLLQLETARDDAKALGKTLYFPDGVYGISDRFMFADGGNAFFAPGASLKLLNATASGGAVSGPYPTQTLPIEIHNLAIDCNNIAGENGIGIGHIIGARLFNLKIKNCLHSTTTFGGKALQFEGTAATNVQVIGLDIEDSTVGIDLGAFTPADIGQTVHISISVVSMKNVDIPVHVNDTYTVTPPDSYDAMEVLIDGLHCRNCGKLTYAGAVATDGGIFVSDRGFKVTARNVQIVNDRGTFGSTAYGAIGGLTRGSFKGLVVEDVLIDADCTALFDFNISTFQSANVNQTGMYVLAKNVRHYGDLEYIVKCPTGALRLGANRLAGIEIGSTAASLTGLLDAQAQTYSNSVLEMVDRDNVFQSTGERAFNRLAAIGNLPSSLGMVGRASVSQTNSTWVPVDASGAGLVFTGVTGEWFRMGELIVAFGTCTYPVTANAVAAKLGGLPFIIDNTGQNRATGILTVSTKANAQKLYPEQNGTTAPILTSTAASATNADCSAGLFAFMFIYKAKA